MQKFSMLQSVQGGPFTNSSRMIDIDIPADNLVDMTQSFIQLETSIAPNKTAGVFDQGVSNLIVSNLSTPSIAPMNVDLVKNAYFSSATKGKLEDIRRVNILSRNLQEFTKSTSEKISSSLNSLSQYTPFANSVQLSPYIEARKIGDVAAVYKHNYLRIPLSQLFQLGSLDVLDTGKLGTCRIHLELDNIDYYGLDLKVNETDVEKIGPTPQTLPAGLTSGFDIPMQKIYDSIEMIPFFVGQYVTVSYKGYSSGNPPTAVNVANTTITKITYNASTGSLVLTTGFKIEPVAPSTSFNDFIVESFAPAAGVNLGSFNILTAQLGLCTIEGASASISPNQIDYLTFTTEEYNAGNQAFMNKIFEIEPECVDVFMMQYNPATPSNLLSVNNDISSYRLRIDGNDVLDRDCFVNLATNNVYAVEPLHYELLKRTFANASFPLKSLESAALSRTDDTPASILNNANNQILLICCPTPMTSETKKFQVNLTTKSNNSTINNVILFKHVFRSIKF